MARQSYEYIVVDIDPEVDDLEEQMNEYGMQQWELRGILSNDASSLNAPATASKSSLAAERGASAPSASP